MNNSRLTNTHETALPPLITWLLSRLANPNYRVELIGDMEEEFIERRHAHDNSLGWLLRQTFLAIWDGQKAMIRTTNFAKALGVVLCVLLIPTIVVFVGWLSNLKDPSEHLWQLIIAGEIHKILFNAEFWYLAWHKSGVSHLELGMFMHIPSLIWGGVFALSAHVFLKKVMPGIWQYSAFALAFFLVPYLFGFALINIFEPVPKSVGPILAFMVLAPFFTLPTYITYLFKGYFK